MDTLEELLLDAINGDIRAEIDYDEYNNEYAIVQGKADAAKACADISRDYAKRFAEFFCDLRHDSKLIIDCKEFGRFKYSEGVKFESITTEELLQLFESQTTKTEK